MKSNHILSFFVLWMPWAVKAAEDSSTPRYHIQMAIRPGDLSYESNARIRMTIEDAQLKPGACLYIPLEDPAFRRSAEIHSLTGHSVRDQASRVNAAIEWPRPDLMHGIRPGYWKLDRVDAPMLISLTYDFTIPGWKDHPEGPRILSDFYPRILPSCPDLEPEEFPELASESVFEIQLELPESWSQLNPGQMTERNIRFRGRDFYLVLYQEGDLQETEVEGLRLRFLGRSDNFFAIARPVKKILRHHFGILNTWPTADLLLVESEEFEPISAAGLVLINRPRQALMRKLQEDFLNWNIWQLTVALAEQWFGYQVRAGRLEDLWLVQSLADSLGLLFLKDSEDYGNLFTAGGKKEPWFKLNFSEAQDLLAATLSLMQNHNALTDAGQRSLPDMLQRPPFAFIRSSQALRVLLKEMGKKEYGRFLQESFEQGSRACLQPGALIQLLQKNFDRKDILYSKLLQDYWESDEWPDASLVKIAEAKDPGETLVQMEYKSELKIPLEVTVSNQEGQNQIKHIMPEDVEHPIVFDVPYHSGISAAIDPERSIFDRDRFNNKSEWPDLNFFPGNARSLADDAYTILWAPFLQKLPGNALSLQLGWQVYRYLGTGLSGWMVYQPKSGKFGYRLQWQQAIPEHAFKINLQVAQDDDHTLPGERLSDLTLTRGPVLKAIPWLDLFMRQRLRQTLGDREEGHLTSAWGMILHSQKRRTCSWRLNTEQEFSSWVPKGDFTYQRDFGAFKSSCEVPGFLAKGSLFWGSTRREGEVPGGALFNPQDIDEGHLRLDHPRLPLSGRIETWGLDFAVPLRLPLPSDFLVLPRRSLFKVFADGGRLQEPDHRVLSSGAGLVLPIGGDVIGKQPITFLEFSLLAVLFRKIDEKTDGKPGFLFDFSGQL